LAESANTKIAMAFPLRSTPVPRNAPAIFAPALGSLMPSRMIAFAPSFAVAAALFLLREGLVEMDVPTC